MKKKWCLLISLFLSLFCIKVKLKRTEWNRTSVQRFYAQVYVSRVRRTALRNSMKSKPSIKMWIFPTLRDWGEDPMISWNELSQCSPPCIQLPALPTDEATLGLAQSVWTDPTYLPTSLLRGNVSTHHHLYLQHGNQPLSQPCPFLINPLLLSQADLKTNVSVPMSYFKPFSRPKVPKMKSNSLALLQSHPGSGASGS